MFNYFKEKNFLSSGMSQNVLIGFICFCCPGMFNALNGIGGGGQVDPSVGSDGNTALYSMFTIFGILGGPINNFLGPRLTVFMGCLTYVLYSCALMAYNHIQSRIFVIVAGALLGVGAGMLWSAQGALMMAYPTTKEKGKFISVFWIIFNLGGMLGGILSFILNFDNDTKGVTDGTYMAFITIMAVGALLSLFIREPKNVTRSDGSKVIVEKYANIQTELKGIAQVFKQWKMLMLIPLFVASNFYYTYQFNGYNTALFSVRARSLNNSCYWAAQMLGSFLLGRFLDNPNFRKKTRAITGLITTCIFMYSIWIGALFVQFGYSRDQLPTPRIDIVESRFIGPFILYLFFGLSDAIVQSWSYWIMGSLTNNTNMLARYSGFYKGFQSAGGAISWRLDSMGVEYMIQLIINWVLFGISSLFALVVSFSIKELPVELDLSEKGLKSEPHEISPGAMMALDSTGVEIVEAKM